MKKQHWILLSLALVMITGTAAFLSRVQSYQRVGPPAVKTRPQPGTTRLAVELPERILDYESEELEIATNVLDTLPKDTSFGQRIYRLAGQPNADVLINVVLMGTDRTSLHKTEYCLEGQGWRIDRNASEKTTIHMERPEPYDLPVMKFIANREVNSGGQAMRLRGVYVFWFVAPDELTANHNQRMWWMARDLLTSGTLQRWACVSYFSVCEPGQEQAAFERIKAMIIASAPQIQTTPKPQNVTASVRP